MQGQATVCVCVCGQGVFRYALLCVFECLSGGNDRSRGKVERRERARGGESRERERERDGEVKNIETRQTAIVLLEPELRTVIQSMFSSLSRSEQGSEVRGTLYFVIQGYVRTHSHTCRFSLSLSFSISLSPSLSIHSPFFFL